MDKLSEKAAREWRADARAAHDDPLLDCLVEITRLHGVTATAQALSSGLPLEEHRLTPALLPRAAARAQLSARVVKRTLVSISQDRWPASRLLQGERACLLLKKEDGKYVVSHPELGGSSVEMTPEALAAHARAPLVLGRHHGKPPPVPRRVDRRPADQHLRHGDAIVHHERV
ncbi:hypothetical protein G6F65_018450 [Rhizopus arrhizus]|nr:hypothetical protein G6F65_018450 [Rhizopus arrhizus]